MVFALSKFQGGGLLVEAPDGVVQRKIADKIYTGVVLEFADGVSICDAKTSCRITEAWAGDRVVLVAYAVMGVREAAAPLHGLERSSNQVPSSRRRRSPSFRLGS